MEDDTSVISGNVDVVMGIDLGTAHSGITFAFVGNNTMNTYAEWPDMQLQYYKTPTVVLYDPQKQFVACGDRTHRLYAELEPEDLRSQYSLMRNFKLALLDNVNGDVVCPETGA